MKQLGFSELKEQMLGISKAYLVSMLALLIERAAREKIFPTEEKLIEFTKKAFNHGEAIRRQNGE